MQDFYQGQFELLGVPAAKTGSITVVQRTNSELRLNPHYPLTGLDGAYTEAEGNPDETPAFHPLPDLTSLDVAELLQVGRVRIWRFLKRQGAVVDTKPLEVSEANAAERGGSAAAGRRGSDGSGAGGARPELLRREPVVLQSSAEARSTGRSPRRRIAACRHAFTASSHRAKLNG